MQQDKTGRGAALREAAMRQHDRIIDAATAVSIVRDESLLKHSMYAATGDRHAAARPHHRRRYRGGYLLQDSSACLPLTIQ